MMVRSLSSAGSRTIIIGECSRGRASPMDPRTSSGRRLAALLGVEDARDAARCVNLCGGADHWVPDLGQRTARELLLALSESGELPPVIGLGRSVQITLRAAARSLELEESLEEAALWVPHTSGLCRAWNDKEATTTWSRAMRRHVRRGRRP